MLFTTTFYTCDTLYLLVDNGHYSHILAMKQFLNVRGYFYKCMTALYKAEGLKTHDCEEMQIQYMRRDVSDIGEDTERDSEIESGDEVDQAPRENISFFT